MLIKRVWWQKCQVPEEVLNFDFGQFCDDDFENYIVIKIKKIYSKPNDMQMNLYSDRNNNAVSVNWH